MLYLPVFDANFTYLITSFTTECFRQVHTKKKSSIRPGDMAIQPDNAILSVWNGRELYTYHDEHSTSTTGKAGQMIYLSSHYGYTRLLY